MVHLRHFSGERLLHSGEALEFGIEFRVTPFQRNEPQRHWRERFYHPNISRKEGKPEELFSDEVFAALRKEGVEVVNLHHAFAANPFINCPITGKSLPVLQSFVERAHRHGLKVCLYYTIRELSLQVPEFWAFASMDGEVLFPGLGAEARPCTTPQGPHEFLVKNLHFPYLSSWAETIKDGECAGLLDLSVETLPHSRLENYYLEGLR